MKKTSRYHISGLTEAQFEAGSHGRVLKNLLGVKSKRQMDQVEGREQFQAFDKLVKIFGQNHRFHANDICKIHEVWLAQVYVWAGQYRQVNISKGDFPFAVAKQIPSLMADFERNYLNQYTPCRFKSMDEIVEAIAVIHTELVLIHPFRDGNGRVARMLASLMALQAGFPPLNFSGIKGPQRKEYFSAVRAGLGRNYKPMEKIFGYVISKTIKVSGLKS
jgi:cell filamentation protein